MNGNRMSRWIALDYGEKRIGVAVTDPLKMFVSPLTTIENKSDKFIFEELSKIFGTQSVERIIVGLPLNIEGEDTIKTIEVRKFFDKLRNETKLPVFFCDERYSTCEANDFLKQKGTDWKKSKDVVDQIAAAVILKTYMDTYKE
jgi:putative Holliday junction resolvase